MTEVEYLNDDYGRDFTMELKGDAEAKEKTQNASMVHRELIELNEILNDHSISAYKEALGELETDEVAILEAISRTDIAGIDDYDPLDDYAEQKLHEAFERAVEVCKINNSYEVKNKIQSALNSLKVALEQ